MLSAVVSPSPSAPPSSTRISAIPSRERLPSLVAPGMSMFSAVATLHVEPVDVEGRLIAQDRKLERVVLKRCRVGAATRCNGVEVVGLANRPGGSHLAGIVGRARGVGAPASRCSRVCSARRSVTPGLRPPGRPAVPERRRRVQGARSHWRSGHHRTRPAFPRSLGRTSVRARPRSGTSRGGTRYSRSAAMWSGTRLVASIFSAGGAREQLPDVGGAWGRCSRLSTERASGPVGERGRDRLGGGVTGVLVDSDCVPIPGSTSAGSGPRREDDDGAPPCLDSDRGRACLARAARPRQRHESGIGTLEQRGDRSMSKSSRPTSAGPGSPAPASVTPRPRWGEGRIVLEDPALEGAELPTDGLEAELVQCRARVAVGGEGIGLAARRDRAPRCAAP